MIVIDKKNYSYKNRLFQIQTLSENKHFARKGQDEQT